MFNLNFETNEILLSSIVNPYHRVQKSDISKANSSFRSNGKEYHHRSISTGDDYPNRWNQLSTDFLLSNDSNEEEKKICSSPHRTYLQRDCSSSSTMNHYQIIDEIDHPVENLSTSFSSNRTPRNTTSSKYSDAGYQTFVSSVDHQQNLSYSTPDQRHCQSSSKLLNDLLERYERTLRERQRAFTFVDDQLLDIDDVLKRYREKLVKPSVIQSKSVRRRIFLLILCYVFDQWKEEKKTERSTSLSRPCQNFRFQVIFFFTRINFSVFCSLILTRFLFKGNGTSSRDFFFIC